MSEIILPPLVEIVPAVEVFTTGICAVDKMGPVTCFTYYVLQRDQMGGWERAIKLRRLCPTDGIGTGFDLMMAALGPKVLKPDAGLALRPVLVLH